MGTLPSSSSSDPRERSWLQLARCSWFSPGRSSSPSLSVPPRRPRDPRRREPGTTSTVGLRRLASHPGPDVDRGHRWPLGSGHDRHDDRRLRIGLPPTTLRRPGPRPPVAPFAARAERPVHRSLGVRPRAPGPDTPFETLEASADRGSPSIDQTYRPCSRVPRGELITTRPTDRRRSRGCVAIQSGLSMFDATSPGTRLIRRWRPARLVASRTPRGRASATPVASGSPDTAPAPEVRKTVTVVFCDLVGSTALSGSARPGDPAHRHPALLHRDGRAGRGPRRNRREVHRRRRHGRLRRSRRARGRCPPRPRRRPGHDQRARRAQRGPHRDPRHPAEHQDRRQHRQGRGRRCLRPAGPGLRRDRQRRRPARAERRPRRDRARRLDLQARPRRGRRWSRSSRSR